MPSFVHANASRGSVAERFCCARETSLLSHAASDVSLHGHPLPLECPADRTRKSISLYYYTNGRPEEERSAPHDTRFLEETAP